MKIQTINSHTNFEAKKNFRVYYNQLDSRYSLLGLDTSKNIYCAKEYLNPKAEEFYKKAQVAKDCNTKSKLYKKMGAYELIVFGTGIVCLLRKFFNKPKKLYSNMLNFKTNLTP